MELTNKTVFITGSSRGIGWGIAKTFAQAGANVVLNGRKEISADKIAEIKANQQEDVQYVDELMKSN